VLALSSSVDVERLSVSPSLSSVVFKLWELLFLCPYFCENMPPKNKWYSQRKVKVNVLT
jgi:hypothetical protein